MRSLLKSLSAFGFVAVVVISQQLGWFAEPQTWEQASGYSTLKPELQAPKYIPRDGQPKIHWLGHAGFLLEWGELRILLDPILSANCAITKRLFPVPLRPQELGRIDAVLLSHSHYDHLDLPTLEGIPEIDFIVLPSKSEDFLSARIKTRTSIVGLKAFERFSLGALTISAVPAVHNGARNHPFQSGYLALGYVLTLNDFSIYFAGDTGWGKHFQIIAEKYQPQAAILPIGGFVPYVILKNYHLDPEDAVRAAKTLGVDFVFPAHFGTYRVALDFADTALPAFARAAAREKILWHMPEVYQLLDDSGEQEKTSSE